MSFNVSRGTHPSESIHPMSHGIDGNRPLIPATPDWISPFFYRIDGVCPIEPHWKFFLSSQFLPVGCGDGGLINAFFVMPSAMKPCQCAMMYFCLPHSCWSPCMLLLPGRNRMMRMSLPFCPPLKLPATYIRRATSLIFTKIIRFAVFSGANF